MNTSKVLLHELLKRKKITEHFGVIIRDYMLSDYLSAKDLLDFESNIKDLLTLNLEFKLGVSVNIDRSTEIESEDRLFGDNDMLSAVVAILCKAHRLIILSDTDGFYDSDPRLYPNAKLIDRITLIDDSVQSLAGGAGSRRGTCGMKTKL